MASDSNPLPTDWNRSGGLDDTDRQAIRALYHAFNVGDPDLLDDAIAED